MDNQLSCKPVYKKFAALYVTDTHIWCLKDENPNLISRIVTLHNAVYMVCLCCKKATKKEITYEHVIELHPLFNIRWIIIILFSCVCLVEIYLLQAFSEGIQFIRIQIICLLLALGLFEVKSISNWKHWWGNPILCNPILFHNWLNNKNVSTYFD